MIHYYQVVLFGLNNAHLSLLQRKQCTASVEEVIDEHYLNQIKQLDNSEPKLKKKIIKFREDELSHKDIAYEKGATKEGPYSVLDKIIKTGSKIAIFDPVLIILSSTEYGPSFVAPFS